MSQNKRNRLPINPESYSFSQTLGRFPSWLHRKLPRGSSLSHTQKILTRHRLNTVCEEAKCPNRFECYSNHTATFLALGKQCTRNCGFCDIDFSKNPKQPEVDEPSRIALCAQELGLKHVVITMVARDDLIDKGASHMAAIIRQIRTERKEVTVEVLTSDFSEDYAAIDLLLQEQPDIFNHNLETVEALTPRVRHKATYLRSLNILSYVKQSDKAQFIKSGLMVGLGETPEQVKRAIDDLKAAGCNIITIGQYLQANRKKLLVKEFITPEQFKKYADYGREIGIKQMFCGPFVRSSYHAHEVKNLMTEVSF
ncbi:Lipoyl synthase [Candidatus Rhabdochlamydia oedothoracis]|uniref:Lipoyl synthase n=1 Tax=Candidatus Rhabdochlamydia oedothoracis TaxID=2720720 RepID=A0ABX8UZC0_9BACT|nr:MULTISPECIES: lipoyl synthase [Rhabdochlamydia]KAG6559586.1 Lipoyl synthase [Candidatus Rhabdochlamydia sp. W815]QYF47971.1 Lipoyl synthase [Candidatus Rhabdochlamydia oedothoracis]